MPDTSAKITDPQLLAQLRASFIAPAQKAQLEALVPKMSDVEKAELLTLINRSHEEKKKADSAYQQNLENLGKEYKQTLKAEDKGFRKELEGIEKTETSQNLRAIEAEVYTIGQAPNSQIHAHGSKGHFLRNLIVLCLFLGLLAGGALYAINSLS